MERISLCSLQGNGSNLFWKLLEILTIIKDVFSDVAVVKWVVENVASMDPSARDEISFHLGFEPVRLDPSDVLPFSRPRFAWTSEQIVPTEECSLGKRN